MHVIFRGYSQLSVLIFLAVENLVSVPRKHRDKNTWNLKWCRSNGFYIYISCKSLCLINPKSEPVDTSPFLIPKCCGGTKDCQHPIVNLPAIIKEILNFHCLRASYTTCVRAIQRLSLYRSTQVSCARQFISPNSKS